MFWAFSIYLEAVAIWPQLQLLQKQKRVANITSYYVVALGAYRCDQEELASVAVLSGPSTFPALALARCNTTFAIRHLINKSCATHWHRRANFSLAGGSTF